MAKKSQARKLFVSLGMMENEITIVSRLPRCLQLMHRQHCNRRKPTNSFSTDSTSKQISLNKGYQLTNLYTDNTHNVEYGVYIHHHHPDPDPAPVSSPPTLPTTATPITLMILIISHSPLKTRPKNPRACPGRPCMERNGTEKVC